MKRIITGGVSALFVAVLLGVTGCDGGGGIEPGMPTDNTPSIPLEQMKAAADMSKTPPPSTSKTALPGKAADAAAAPEAEKEKEKK
jgi:hypothetical protein